MWLSYSERIGSSPLYALLNQLMKNKILFIIVTLIIGFSYISNPVAIAQESEVNVLTEDEAKIAQEKLESAMKSLKREIKFEAEVANGGTITGIVKCEGVTSENIVVYIEKVGDNNYPVPLEHGILDQLNKTFVPHVMAIQRGTTVDFPNNDLLRHNVFSPPDCCKQFNLGTYGVGVVKHVKFDESCEIQLLCNVHTEMSAFVLVLDNPYFSVTGRSGEFKIENVPPGNYKLSAWHEKLRTVTKDVTVEAGKTTSVGFEL